MKKRLIVSLPAVVGIVLLSACGDDVTKVTNVTNESSGMDVVTSADSLGTCDTSTLGKTVFASDKNIAYICTDSGWTPLSKASKGKDGTSCVVETLTDSSGYKIVCGEDSIGIIKNGKNGSDGSGCSLADNGDGTVTQVCGEDTVTLYKMFCGRTPYDPAKSFCLDEAVYDLCDGNSYDPSAKFCDLRDMTLYGYIVIGEQTWMVENLNYAYTQKTSELDSSSFCFNDSTKYCDKTGRLYLWSAAMDSAAIFSDDGKGCGYGAICSASGNIRGVCPEGWHLPDTTEWEALEKFVADSLFNGDTTNVGYALKSTSGWYGNGNGSDAFGFGAHPAGYRLGIGLFHDELGYAMFWSSTENRSLYTYYRKLYYSVTALNTGIYGEKNFAFSVRCVKD